MVTILLSLLGLVGLALVAWWLDRRARTRDTPHWTALKANSVLKPTGLGPRTRFTGDPERHRVPRPDASSAPPAQTTDPPRRTGQGADVPSMFLLAERHEMLALARAFARRHPDQTVIVHGPQGDRRRGEIVN